MMSEDKGRQERKAIGQCEQDQLKRKQDQLKRKQQLEAAKKQAQEQLKAKDDKHKKELEQHWKKPKNIAIWAILLIIGMFIGKNLLAKGTTDILKTDKPSL